MPGGIAMVTVEVSGPGRSVVQRLLPGTMRVAPFASVKSWSGHITLTTTSLYFGYVARYAIDVPFEDGEHIRMQRERVEGAGLGEQCVDAPRAPALEVVPTRRRVSQDPLEIGSGPRHLLGPDGVGHRRVAPLDQRRHGLVDHACSFRGCPPVPSSLRTIVPQGNVSHPNHPEGNVKPWLT